MASPVVVVVSGAPMLRSAAVVFLVSVASFSPIAVEIRQFGTARPSGTVVVLGPGHRRWWIAE